MTTSTPTISKSASKSAKRKSEFTSLPNLLTYLRIALVPVMVGCFFLDGMLAHSIALVIFLVASITDFFDGLVARQQQNASSFGGMLDPIADKLLISAALFLLIAWDIITDWSLFAALIILSREILVSGLREHLAKFKVSVPVSLFAKWKTLIQIIAVACLIAAPIGEAFSFPSQTVNLAAIGLTLLWIAAIITIYTGYDYFKNGIAYFSDKEQSS